MHREALATFPRARRSNRGNCKGESMRNVMVKGLVLVAVLGVGAAFAQDKPQDKAAAPAGDKKLYTVVDGYKVDPATMNGFRAWRAAACDRCHGANQEGLVG